METFETKPKKWGNSLGITIPKEIVKKEKLSTKRNIKVIIIGEAMEDICKTFGTLKLKMQTQIAMEDMDGGYD